MPHKLKKAVFNLAFLFFWLFLLFLTEMALRMAKIGVPTQPFTSPSGSSTILIEDVNFPKKYFPKLRSQGILRNKTRFGSPKNPNTLRGIIVGESTPQGFPFESGHSFGSYLSVMLQNILTNRNIEIINSCYSAQSSYYVRDAGLKMLSYEPDFLIVYVGHNEYYGVVAQLDGGNHWSRLMILALKESRIFQLLFRLFDFSKPMKGNELMKTQFAQKEVKPNQDAENRVLADYLDNLETLIRACKKKNVPVIVIEPVCNLLDMPPFRGLGDEKYGNFISNFAYSLRHKDQVKLEDFAKTALSDRSMMSNANIVYLLAQSKAQLTGMIDMDGLVKARDLDTVPFRAKSTLQDGLAKFAKSKKKEYPNLIFIPLQDIMRDKMGLKAFGHEYFIDHVHFNQRGHQLVARLLAKNIIPVIYKSEKEAPDFSPDEQKDLEKKIWYLPLYEYLAYNTIHAMSQNPPFQGMLLNYDPPKIPDSEIGRNGDLVARIRDAAMNGDPMLMIFQAVSRYYIEKKDITNLIALMRSHIYLYPGSEWPYLNLAKLYLRAQGHQEEAKSLFVNAYLLSGKDKKIKDEILWYFPEMEKALQ